MVQTHDLQNKITQKYGSIHAFCKAFPHLNRATVYQVLSGKYAGKTPKQIELIKIALAGNDKPTKTVTINKNDLKDVLQAHKCNHCRLLNKNNCSECKNKTIKEVTALHNYISGIL